MQVGVARAARSCKEDVPAPHSPYQLPEQDLTRAREETQALNLQVQNYSLILQVQNLNLQSKIFCSACLGGFLSFPVSVSLSIVPAKRNILAGPSLSSTGSGGGTREHQLGIGHWKSQQWSLWRICPSTTLNSVLVLQLSSILFLPLCAKD